MVNVELREGRGKIPVPSGLDDTQPLTPTHSTSCWPNRKMKTIQVLVKKHQTQQQMNPSLYPAHYYGVKWKSFILLLLNNKHGRNNARQELGESYERWNPRVIFRAVVMTTGADVKWAQQKEGTPLDATQEYLLDLIIIYSIRVLDATQFLLKVNMGVFAVPTPGKSSFSAFGP